MKMKTQPTRTYGHSKTVLRGKFIAMSAYIKDRKIANKQPNAISQTPRKTRASKTQNKQKERNSKK
jgi:hypothetical protein